MGVNLLKKVNCFIIIHFYCQRHRATFLLLSKICSFPPVQPFILFSATPVTFPNLPRSTFTLLATKPNKPATANDRQRV